MKCNKAHKWIALYREGELEAGIRDRLREHLAECESCSQMYRAYVKNDAAIAQIRSQSPVCKDENIITNRIVDTVAEIKKRSGETGFVALLDRILNRILDLSLLPAVRRIAVACILIIAAIFVYQQVYIYSNTARLEEQLSAAGKARLTNSASDELQDCMKKSARYLSGVKTGRIKINKQIGEDISENPEVLMQYASFFCTHKYKYLENSIRQDAMIIPDFLMDHALENVQKYK
jgi:hypothetical protein